MESVPLHSEVVQFARELVEAIRTEPSVEGEYDVSLDTRGSHAPPASPPAPPARTFLCCPRPPRPVLLLR